MSRPTNEPPDKTAIEDAHKHLIRPVERERLFATSKPKLRPEYAQHGLLRLDLIRKKMVKLRTYEAGKGVTGIIMEYLHRARRVGLKCACGHSSCCLN